MALLLPPGLTPPEAAFLCEMELVTVIPRQRLDPLPLLSGPSPSLTAGRSAPLPLYLALLLHRQRRAHVVAPPWLAPASLEVILKAEIDEPGAFSAAPPFPTSTKPIASPPFLTHHIATAGAGSEGRLPYHWLEMGEMLLAQCPEAFGAAVAADATRALLRDIREVRQSKLRAGMAGLEGGGVVSLRGVGAMELAAERAFVVGLVAGLRGVGASREAARREREEEEGVQGGGEDYDDGEMEL